ncbi:MAG: hypothetical protein K9H12_12465 [Bacteroidales bacterium]|nr:hypothetical protein [Bacteroidales bacterium]
MTKFRNSITLGFFLIITLTSNCQETLIDTSIIYADTARIDGISYTAIFRTDDFFYILDSKENIVFKSKDYYRFFEFTDFNNDGKKDLMFSYLGNNPIKDLILYDIKNRKFVPVKNFKAFPEPIRIKGTKYYYSYHRSGCADMNWDSDLFYIENFIAIRLGKVSGRECDNSDEKNGVYIYKLKGNKEELIEAKDINEIHKFKNDKWDFIIEYWTKNYMTFE